MGCSASSGADGSGSAPSEELTGLQKFLRTKPEEIDLSKEGRQNKPELGIDPDTRISYNHLPKELWTCDSCKKLTISFHDMSALPVELCDMKNLEELDVSQGALTTLPVEICRLTKLKSLMVFENKLTSLPAEIGQLVELDDANFFNNQLTKIPPEIANLTKLTQLNLGDNKFMQMPSLEGMESLEKLQFQWGYVAVFQGSWAGLSNLKCIMGNRCRYASLPDLPPGLEKLDVSKNHLTELQISNCTALTEIRAFSNELVVIPPAACRAGMEHLNFADNKIEVLPPEIGNCAESLQQLFLESNKLKQLPASAALLTKLQRCNLEKNSLDASDADTVATHKALKESTEANKGRFWGCKGL